MKLERMDMFFNDRVSNYEEHMMTYVDGATQYYYETAQLIPAKDSWNILDLGCGTGLEIDALFQRNPDIRVMGIDLAEGMLDKLQDKYLERKEELKLVIADYFEYELPKDTFDYAVSVQSLHHYTHIKKIGLYKKVYRSLKGDGVYIETDYMAPDQDYEDYHFEMNKQLRKELGITTGFYHYDTPCTIENQMKMLYEAGFKEVKKVWKQGNAVILVAIK